ncbi:hypothetical protein JWG45_07225 [Leptospira sp. 201903070]|uniref:Lipoprotein n=1 Tax=Leptospira ainlahdjerensis TaxID=2810033 RepID=A0ABS2U998_9LEPT|nr:hypothetical protein [Leptospira ainlahdjerensis]MBM9576942.1 hypothetical protein [Leptospira ainlahdjerensis]
MKKSFWILYLSLSIGCSSTGYDRGPLPEVNPSKIVIDSEEIKHYLSLKPQLRFPFRVGVYFLDPEGYKYRIDAKDKTAILNSEEVLKAEKIVSQMFLISASVYDLDSEKYESGFRNHYPNRTRTLDGIKKIRILASRYGADAVLVIKATPRYAQKPNILSLLYATIVGIWLVPGSYGESTFTLEGTLWDVRNEYLYLTTESEASSSSTRPYGWIDEYSIVAESKEKAIREFSAEIVKRFKSMK